MPTLPVLVPPPLPQSWPFPGNGAFGGGGDGDSGDGGGSSNWSSLIGIVTAIVGNVLIALALNVQRYAHTRLHKEQQRMRERARQAAKGEARRARTAGTAGTGCYGSIGQSDGLADYSCGNDGHAGATESDPLTGTGPARQQHGDAGWPASSESRKFMASPATKDSNNSAVPPPSTSYLHSPYWWLGQVLITVGECGNFLAYGFAPASIVSPLGVVALISNCVIAPILFKEPVRPRDFGGVVIAIAGAVTVVLSANQQETKLNPHDVWDAITATAFEIYGGVTAALIALLMWASPRYGHRTILIDLGLVGLFGAYTVLATKGVSSMLSSTLLGAFLTPMTYGLLVVLLGTAVMQVRYVNKALQRFDSTQVIPIQFVLFTLSVIIGSAVLYRDFERTTAEQAAKFVGGCLLTFFGVFIITSGRPLQGEEEEEDDDDDEAEEEADVRVHSTTGGDDVAACPPQSQSPLRPTLRSTAGSRRSSRASRVNFVGTLTNRRLSLVAATDTGVPSLRALNTAATVLEGAGQSTCKVVAEDAVYVYVEDDNDNDDNNNDNDNDNDDDEESADESGPSHPLLQNPWRSASFSAAGSTGPPPAATHLLRPSLEPAPYSADSVLQTTVAADHASAPPRADRPVTPATLLRSQPQTPATANSSNNNRPYYYSHQSPLFSPSLLLSSTVTSAMADTILQHLEGGSPQATRRPSTRRARSTLRSSLFVPQDELDRDRDLDLADGAERGLLSGTSLYRQTQRSAEALASAVGTAGVGTAGLVDVPEEEVERPSVRGRARSISMTLGGLLWPRRLNSGEESVEAGHHDTADRPDGSA